MLAKQRHLIILKNVATSAVHSVVAAKLIGKHLSHTKGSQSRVETLNGS